jgi:hypothetical protein
MKKFLYIIMLLVVVSFSFTSCTKEEVKPQTLPSVQGDIKE